MAPLVSILIPAFNAERWIGETLASAINQKYANTEVILVDDGSSDRTLEIARHFESSRVKLVRQENAGGPSARNTALTHAQGQYIQWLDHDDILSHSKISTQMQAIERGGDELTAYTCPFGRFYHRVDRAEVYSGPLCKDLSPVDYFLIKFSRNTYFQSSSWLISRKLTDLAGPWWELRSPDDDGEYFCRVVGASKAVKFVSDAMCYWRVGNSGSFSFAWTKSSEAVEATFSSMVRCIEHFRRLEDSPRVRAACVQFLQDRIWYFFPESPELLERIDRLAFQFGGRIAIPQLSWKYEWIRKAFGWNAAKRCLIMGRRLRISSSRMLDYVPYVIRGKDPWGNSTDRPQ